MLADLINQAKQIEATTEANIGGAVNQVIKNLSIDEMAEIYQEVFTDKKLNSRLKDIEFAKNNQDNRDGRMALNDIRGSIYTLVLNRARQK